MTSLEKKLIKMLLLLIIVSSCNESSKTLSYDLEKWENDTLQCVDSTECKFVVNNLFKRSKFFEKRKNFIDFLIEKKINKIEWIQEKLFLKSETFEYYYNVNFKTVNGDYFFYNSSEKSLEKIESYDFKSLMFYTNEIDIRYIYQCDLTAHMAFLYFNYKFE
ncbi:hypothetical protein [Flammeovirga aprica]|nr:hypothetical protein [Flammeovirga aprica]